MVSLEIQPSSHGQRWLVRPGSTSSSWRWRRPRGSAAQALISWSKTRRRWRRPTSRAAAEMERWRDFMFFFFAGWWFGCHECYFPIHIGFIIIPIDFHIFQRGSKHQPGKDGRCTERKRKSPSEESSETSGFHFASLLQRQLRLFH